MGFLSYQHKLVYPVKLEQDFTGVSKIAVNQESAPYGHQVDIIDNSIEWQFFNDSES